MAGPQHSLISYSNLRRSIKPWMLITVLASLCFSLSMYSLAKFLTSPSQDSSSVLGSYLASNNYEGWINYAVWRSSLIPDFWLFLTTGAFLLMFAFLLFPFKNGKLSQRISSTRFGVRFLSAALVGSLVILEIAFLGWAYEMGQLLHVSSSALLYPAYLLANDFTFGNLQPNQDYPFFIILLMVVGLASLRFRSIWKTLQVLSISIIPLPVYVYIFDSREFFVHFENQFKTFSFITNFDVMIGSVLVFSLSCLIERRHFILGSLRKLPYLESILDKNNNKK